MRIVKISDLSDEEKKKWQEEYEKRNTERIAYKQAEIEKINREFEKNHEEQSRIAQNPVKNFIGDVAQKGLWIGKKTGTGALSGTAGIGQAGITELANNFNKGKKKNINELLNDVSNSVTLNPINDTKKMWGNILSTVDPTKKWWENLGAIGTNISSNAINSLPVKKQFNALSQITGKILPSNASDKVMEINNAISKPIEKLNQKLDEEGKNYDKFTQTVGNVGQVVGNMAPSIGATIVTKDPTIGLGIMGLSAKGQATQEALNKGATLDEAIKIGDTKATIEVGTEMLTGGVNIFGKGALDEIVEKGINKKVKNQVLNYLTKKGTDIGGEILEETISDVLGTVIDRGTVDPNATYSISDFNDTAVTTMLSTLVLNTIGGGYSKRAYNENVQNIQEYNTQNNPNNVPVQQINQEQNKMAQNENTEQILPIENSQEILYNNNESESGIYGRENQFTNQEQRTINERGILRNNETMRRQEQRRSTGNIENTEGQNIGSGVRKDSISQRQTIEEAYNDRIAIRETINYANKNQVIPNTEILQIQKEAQEMGLNVIPYNGQDGNKHIGLLEGNNVYLDMNINNTSIEDGSVTNRFFHEVLHHIKRNTSFKNTINELQEKIVSEHQGAIDSFINNKGYSNENISDNIKMAITEEMLADYSAKHMSKYDIDYGLPSDIVYTLNQSIKDGITEMKLNTQIQQNNVPISENKTNNTQTQVGYNLPLSEKQRKHYKSIIESQYTTDQAKTISKELMGTDTYVPESNNKQLENADKRIEISGADTELKSLTGRTVAGERMKAEDVAVGERLIQYYSKTGNATQLAEAIRTTAMIGTQAGQTVQAMSLLNHQTPEGQAIWLQRSVEKMNNDLRKARGENAEQFNLTPEMQEKIVNSKNKQELQNNLNEVYAELGQQVSKTMSQKIDSWRYFAMLANPRTHIRNIIGNKAMGGMQYGIKNKIAGGIEAVASKFNPKIERTHTLIRSSENVRNFARADIENVADRLGLNENKYNPKSRLENSMRTFKSDFMENTVGKAFEFNNNLLEAEDGWGLKAGYVKSLSEYMTANNLTPDNITDAQLAKARNHAVQEAKEATFHQDSQIASLLNQLSNKNKFSKFVMDSILPFKKTPINVAKAGIEYSPIGLVKSAVYDVSKLRKGNITINQYIDNVSKGLTGTGIALMGYALAKAGILKASGSDDKDKEEFEEARGNQGYSISIGNNTYSLDWLAPSGIPLFIGTEVCEIMQSSDEVKSSSNDDNSRYNKAIKMATNTLDAFTNSMNPMTEMSMLSGLTSALKSYDQGSSQMFANIGTNAVKSYVNQFVPTALGQIAKTADEYERSTTSTKTGVLPKAIDTTKTQIMSKIPGLRQMLPVRTDIWGNEQKQAKNIGQRLLENAVLPYTRKEIQETVVDKELKKLYEDTGESSILPDTINKKLTINKQDYIMTSKEFADHKQQFGQETYDLLKELVTSKDYKNATNEQKTKAINKVYEYAKEGVKIDYANDNNLYSETSTLFNTMQYIIASKGNKSDYLNYVAKTEGLKDAEKINFLSNANFSDTTKKAIYINTVGKKDNLYNVLEKTGINISEYLGYKIQKFESDKKDDGTVTGSSISGSKKAKVYEYVNNMDIAYEQRLLILGMQYGLTNQEKSKLVRYINGLNIDKSEKLDIYQKLKGFTIYKDGTIKY